MSDRLPFPKDLYIAVLCKPSELKNSDGSATVDPSKVENYHLYHLREADYQKPEFEVPTGEVNARIKMLLENGVVLAAIPPVEGGINTPDLTCYLINLSALKNYNPAEGR